MAADTPKSLRNQLMYSVFVRNYSPEGTFAALQADLPRIRALGADVIWLLPIHPIGEKCRKGTLGSPYAIRDYRAVNPEFGSLEDFIALADAVHALNMKLIIDVVYNHTSPDSVLAGTHPEWFYRRADGGFGNRIGDWSDVIDLDYGRAGLWEYQIETLKYWARYVDGFRCDVAPLVPLEFWKKARSEVARVRPGCLWLAESVEPEFIAHVRGRGMTGLSDAEIFQAFDVSYEYDTYPQWCRLLAGECSLSDYAAELNRQETAYPDNYVKLRFLENHDRPRAAFLAPERLAAWTGFLYFQRGMALLYNGQEAGCDHRPGLFDRDPIEWRPGIEPLLQRLLRVRRHPLLAEGSYRVRDAGNGVLAAAYEKDGRSLLGFFAVSGAPAPVRVPLPDGRYENLAGNAPARVECGWLSVGDEPVVLEVAAAD